MLLIMLFLRWPPHHTDSESNSDMRMLLVTCCFSGGRLTTRRTAWKGLQFDHGMQFIRPVSNTFRAIAEDWAAAGVIAAWPGSIVRLDAHSGTITTRRDCQQQQQQGAAAGDTG